tara:strand:+ start:186 stop:1877 length:1692 start_codon:yes stop_codon:yes gene_type:complete
MDIWAIIYEVKLVGVPEENVLHNISYFGQSLPKYKKFNSAEEVLKNRKKQHNSLAIREPKELGFMNALRIYGIDAFDWIIVESKYVEYEKAQLWADNREKYYISQNGGIMRDMDKKLNQTFNLQSGGQGDPNKIFESIEAISNKAWNKFINHLEEFYKENGNIEIPYNYICNDGYPLGQTIVTVRAGNMLNSINSEERKRILDNFPGWTWNIIEDKFEKFYTELCKYKDKYNHCNVNQTYITEDGYKLGNYLNKVRHGQYVEDFPRRKQRLDDLGVTWHPQEERREKTWEQVKDELSVFYKDNKHSNVPKSTPLGKIVSHIRSRQDFVKDNPERLEFLKSINFIWNVRVHHEEEEWLEFWSHMEKFYENHEHSNVPNDYKSDYDDYPLGSRCNAIRNNNQFMNDNKKKQQLEKIGFSWDPLLDKWEKFLKELLKYYEVNKHCKVPYNEITDDGYRLGQTVSTVRNKKIYLTGNSERENSEREQKLNEIGFIWSPFDEAWNNFLKNLKDYIKKNGSPNNIVRNTKLPNGYKLGEKIKGIQSQNQLYIKNKPERKEMLIKLGLKL